jgi:hypothetical protein
MVKTEICVRRLVAFFGAAVMTAILLGSQLDLAAHYSDQTSSIMAERAASAAYAQSARNRSKQGPG